MKSVPVFAQQCEDVGLNCSLTMTRERVVKAPELAELKQTVPSQGKDRF